MNKNGSGDKFLDFAVLGAAVFLFVRTADVLSYFSPSILNDILGFNVNIIYGVGCAVLVEGVALALHFNRRAKLSSTAQNVKWALLAISGACQVFDGFVITNTLAQQTETMRAVFSYGVPLIPLFILVMVFGIGHLPEEDEVVVRPRVGVRNHLRNIWYGEENTRVSPKVVRQLEQVEEPELEAVGNGANPTNGKRS